MTVMRRARGGAQVDSLDWKTISLASIGGGLEFYDFIVYGIFAKYIASTFFPATDPNMSLVAAFAAFAIGYLARPLGGVIVGHLGDRFGRKGAFTLTLIAMTCATLAMALTPSYAAIGPAATVIFVALRFFQGCCVGGELPGAITYVVETAPRRAGLACGLMFLCVNTGSLLANGASSLLHALLSVETVQVYGWRIAFGIGAILGVFGFFLRSSLRETEAFRALGQHQIARIPALDVIRRHWPHVLIGIGIVSINQALIATLNVAMAPFLMQVAGYENALAANAVSLSIAVLSLGILLFGFASDFVPRQFIYLAGTITVALGAYPFYAIIISHSANIYLLFALGGSVCSLIAGTFGAIAAELFPNRLRLSGLAISYNLSAAMIGGFTPLIVSWISASSGDKAAPGIFLVTLACVGIASGLALGLPTVRGARDRLQRERCESEAGENVELSSA